MLDDSSQIYECEWKWEDAFEFTLDLFTKVVRTIILHILYYNFLGVRIRFFFCLKFFFVIFGGVNTMKKWERNYPRGL